MKPKRPDSFGTLPLPLLPRLRKLGRDLCDARRRRRIPTTLMAERAMISRTTLHRIERGDPGVSLGNYSRVLFVLRLDERIGDLADPGKDVVGLDLEAERLPKRIRLQKRMP
jgi:transcriptional regulator with XRE-family HTH domain